MMALQKIISMTNAQKLSAIAGQDRVIAHNHEYEYGLEG
jgi:hypothetical protein